MRIVNLIEDTVVENGFKSEHGLCFYIETSKHKILCDTGASDAFIYNAQRLNINLEQVDMVILSHGHYDHCGGVMEFAKINSKADIYIQQSACEDYYNIKNGFEKYIGINKEILTLKQLKLINGDYKIDDELAIFTGINPDLESFKGNLFLKKKVGDELLQDNFNHEQCLVISEKSDENIIKNVLISGCAHNGILNIIQQYNKKYDYELDAIFSGFHMMKDGEYTDEEIRIIQEMAHKLNDFKAIFYTGHCTGKDAFLIMKKIMNDKLFNISVGTQWDI